MTQRQSRTVKNPPIHESILSMLSSQSMFVRDTKG